MLIITGRVRAGKTTLLRALHQAWQVGDGLYNERTLPMEAGQALIRMKTGERKLFACKQGAEPADWVPAAYFGDTSFSKDGLEFAAGGLDEVVFNGSGPIWVDEIGPLELQGDGLCKPFQAVLESGRDVIVVIREGCLNEVKDRFQIEMPVIIRV
ncbi:MAG: nucleoside-triphosphatase [Solirubrobacterales bacterium]